MSGNAGYSTYLISRRTLCVNCMEELLEEKNKELEQLETQLLTCQQAIRRLRSVCRDYEQEREINSNWKLSSLEDILKRLGAQIPYSEEKKSKSPFTKEGEKAYDDLKKILSAVGNLMGTDMKKIINLLEDAAIQKQNDLELYQLRLLLKTFEEHSWKGNYSLGKWKISNGGYDL